MILQSFSKIKGFAISIIFGEIWFLSMRYEKGLLLFTDINFRPTSGIYFAGRIIFFRTDSYDSRVYEFENDLTGVISNPALFGEGMKWYFVLKYKSNFGATVSFKYSELYKPNDKTIGSGYNQINGPLDNKIGLQIDWNF